MQVGNGKKKKKGEYGTSKSIDIDKRSMEGKKKVNDTSLVYEKKKKATKESGKKEPVKKPLKGILGTESEKDLSQAKESKGTQKKKQKSKGYIKVKKLKKMSGGRIFACVLMGVMGASVLSLGVYGFYYNQIRYPSQMVEDVDSSGLGALNRFVSAINTLSNDKISDITGVDSFLSMEIEYANGDEDKEEFIANMVSTVSYEPKKVVAKNKYGNIMVDRDTEETVYTDSLVNGEDESVVLHYIDYSKVKLDQEKIQELMAEEDLKPGDVDYSNKLVSVFCKYMNALDYSGIPLVDDDRVPNLVKDRNGYSVTSDEDIYIDKALFSSEEFYSFLTEFSRVAVGSEEKNPKWDEWNKLSEEEKSETKEPRKTLKKMQPSKEWQEWDKLDEATKEKTEEPEKYDPKLIISKDWCGSYYLQNEYSVIDENGNEVKKSVSAELGTGELENPAGLNTDVITYVFIEEEDSNGNPVLNPYPIRIRLTDFRVSEEAIEWFQSKDERNRGYDIKSEIQYCCYTYEVTNLSDKTLTIKDFTSLADENANLAPRTGTVYGLKEEITLAPDKVGVLESWGNSTELNTKYLIWGSNFERKEPVVWFRVLAGDIDDPSDDKGVTLNKSRYEDSSEE